MQRPVKDSKIFVLRCLFIGGRIQKGTDILDNLNLLRLFSKVNGWPQCEFIYLLAHQKVSILDNHAVYDRYNKSRCSGFSSSYL